MKTSFCTGYWEFQTTPHLFARVANSQIYQLKLLHSGVITFAKIAKQCEVIMQEASKAWDFLCSLRRRPVYTLRIAGPICRHDGKGTLIVRLIWRPICGRKSTDSVNFLHIFFLAFIYKMVFFANNFVVYCNKTKLLCNNYISSDYKKKKKKKKSAQFSFHKSVVNWESKYPYDSWPNTVGLTNLIVRCKPAFTLHCHVIG